MAGDTVIVVIGNLTADPELRFTPSGAAVANFTVASTPRKFDKQTEKWVDLETLFMRCSLWREQAENACESLRRGHRVIVQGRLTQRSYQTKEGEKRTVVELDVEEIGASLRSATVVVHKTERGGQPRNDGWGQQPADDPWATPQPALTGTVQDPPQASPGAAGGWGGSGVYGDEPPFAFPPTVIS